jgi:ATP-dependent DNA ligase
MQHLKIAKIEKLEMVADRYDIQVADNENFFANGVLVHNCRTIAFVTDKGVTYYARSGKVSEHLNGVFDAELERIRAHVQTDFVLDGESFASDFTETMNAKKEGNDTAKANLRLRAFFMMSLSHWISRNAETTMRSCRASLEHIIKATGCEKILLTEGREVKDYADMVAYCNEVIDVHKQEGLILKNWDATYQWDRTMDWCKVKRMWDVDGKIVGFYPGRKKSRLENTLGGITVRGVDEHGTTFEVNVGSGFTDEMRTEIWNNRDKYLDATVTVQYQEMCKSKDADIMSLRFPVFMRFRDDK